MLNNSNMAKKGSSTSIQYREFGFTLYGVSSLKRNLPTATLLCKGGRRRPLCTTNTFCPGLRRDCVPYGSERQVLDSNR